MLNLNLPLRAVRFISALKPVDEELSHILLKDRYCNAIRHDVCYFAIVEDFGANTLIYGVSLAYFSLPDSPKPYIITVLQYRHNRLQLRAIPTFFSLLSLHSHNFSYAIIGKVMGGLICGLIKVKYSLI
jgi:hypothetical protein